MRADGQVGVSCLLPLTLAIRDTHTRVRARTHSARSTNITIDTQTCAHTHANTHTEDAEWDPTSSTPLTIVLAAIVTATPSSSRSLHWYYCPLMYWCYCWHLCLWLRDACTYWRYCQYLYLCTTVTIWYLAHLVPTVTTWVLVLLLSIHVVTTVLLSELLSVLLSERSLESLPLVNKCIAGFTNGGWFYRQLCSWNW